MKRVKINLAKGKVKDFPISMFIMFLDDSLFYISMNI